MNAESWLQLKELFNTAIELKPEERSPFLEQACDGDLELRAKVERLVAAHDDAGAFLISPALVDIGVITEPNIEQRVEVEKRVGHRVGPYEIVREIGRGGMGTVFLAVRADDQYRKQVAIKVVNRGMDTDAILRRFMMERQILANLEHPNIAGLLEGGTTSDGLPYFVMEYVDGRPIDEYCDAQHFTTTQRLELFREVCAALQYAHQNLTIHRDIKPGNILVTTGGVPKLLDFGIAKLLSPNWSAETGEATLTMQRLMTPGYASPEQLRGLTITTASDVYSLGVVLYELLSGHRPYTLNSRNPEEVAHVILSEEPLKPSLAISDFGLRISESRAKTSNSKDRQDLQTNPQSEIRNPKSLRGDLDNIVLKALRKEPQRRYASVHELSEDLQRHLAGLPVSASPDTFSYRAKKFAQRNKAAVIAAAVVLITLCAATGVTAWQARVARRERDKAQRRFAQVRKLANSVLFEYHDGIEKLPGSTPIREKMVKDALEYLDNLSSESSGDQALQSELAEAYEKVGNVQGNPFGANLGNREGALTSYRKAVKLREALFVANPADQNIKLALAQGHKNVADILWAKGDNEGALANYREGLAMFEQLVQLAPDNPTYLAHRNLSLNGIANVQAQSGDFNGALGTYRKCLANAESVYATNGSNKFQLRNVAVANLKVGDALMNVSDYAGALPHYEKSVELFAGLAGLSKTDASASREVGLSYSRVASAHISAGHFEKSVEFNLKAIAQQKQVAAADPDNEQAQFDLAATHQNLASVYLRMKQTDNAVASVREAVRLFSAGLATNPDFLQAQGNLGGTYITYGEILLARNDVNGASENFHKALAILEREPARSAQTTALVYLYSSLGDLDLKLATLPRGQSNQQADHFRKAKDWYEKTLDVQRGLDQQGKGAGEDKATTDEITRKITQCDIALAKIKTHPN